MKNFVYGAEHWMLDARYMCAGHTFVPNHEVFLPKYQLDPLEMAVSVVNLNEATYRTVYFENIGPTPILYELDKDTSGFVIVIIIIISRTTEVTTLVSGVVKHCYMPRCRVLPPENLVT